MNMGYVRYSDLAGFGQSLELFSLTRHSILMKGILETHLMNHEHKEDHGRRAA